MTHDTNGHDIELREAFRSLERIESARAPKFESTLSRARRRRAVRRTRRGAVATGAIAALVLLVSTPWVDRSSDSALAAELLATRGLWRSPSDVLLEHRPDPLWQTTEKLRETLTYTRIPQ